MIKVFFVVIFFLSQFSFVSADNNFLIVETSLGKIEILILKKSFDSVKDSLLKPECRSGYINYNKEFIEFIVNRSCKVNSAIKNYRNDNIYSSDTFGTIYYDNDAKLKISTGDKKDSFKKDFVFGYTSDKNNLKKFLQKLDKKKERIKFSIRLC